MTELPGSRRNPLGAILFILFAAGFLSAPTNAVAECRQNLSDSWTRTERAAWESLIRGDEFDADEYSPDQVGQRVIRARFFRDVFTCETLSGLLSQLGVALRGVVIPETIDLRLVEVPVRFSCTRCLISKIDGRESKWRKSLVLDDSRLREGLDFRFAHFDGEFRARRVVSDTDVRLDQVSVSGNLNLIGMRSLGRLSMRDGHVSAKLRLDGARLASLDLSGARIGGQLVLSGIRIGQRAVLNRMRIGGDLLLRTYTNGPKPVIGLDYSIQEVQELARKGIYVLLLNNASIGGRLEIAHAHINGPMSLDAIRVDEDIWLRDCSLVAGPIQMPFARIGQNFDLSTTVLWSIDATGSKIAGELRLGTTGSARLTSPVWNDKAKITLRNVSVSAWVDAADSESPRNDKCLPIEADADPWPPTIDVIGFSYDRAGGLGGGIETERPDHWYVAWLDRQKPFSLDPYRRLASFLKGNGRDSAANSVLFAGKEKQLIESRGLTKALLFLQKIFVGYGIYSWYVFIWVIGFILLGGFIFSRTDEARKAKIPLYFAYSADMFLPFVRFRKLHEEIDFRGPARYYLYFHKLMGWVCASFFLGALAGLFEV